MAEGGATPKNQSEPNLDFDLAVLEEVVKMTSEPNPLLNLFPPTGAEKEEVSSDEEPEIPRLGKNSTEADLQKREQALAIKHLKQQRTISYRCITRMAKSVPKDRETKELSYWKDLWKKAFHERERLQEITQQLNLMDPNISEAENEKAQGYQQILDSTIESVGEYIDALESSFSKSMKTAKQSLARGKAMTDPSEIQNNLMLEYTRVNMDLSDLRKKVYLGATGSRKEEPNFQGIKRLEPKKFSGDESTFHFWREQFLASVQGRNLEKTHLALMLYDCLEGKAEKACHNHVRARIDHTTYDLMWKILEKRFGGDYREDQFVTDQFEKAAPLREFSLKELERVYDIFSVQLHYYQRVDKNALTNSRSLLMKLAKRKFTSEQSFDYLKFIQDKGKADNFQSLVDWLDQKLNFVQRAEKEFLSVKGTVNPEKYKSSKPVYHSNPQDTESEAESASSSEDDSSMLHLQHQMEELAHCFNTLKFQRKGQKGKRRYEQPKTAPEPKKETQVGWRFPASTGCLLCKSNDHKVVSCPQFESLDDKRKQAVVQRFRICFHCLQGSHKVRLCKTNPKKLCGVGGCVRYHHPLLHPTGGATFFEDRDSTSSELPDLNLADFENFHVASPGSISLQTLVCHISNRGASFPIVVLLDSGASSTLIDENLAKDLKLPVKLGPITRKVNYADRKAEMKSTLVEFQVATIDGYNSQSCFGWTVKDLAKNAGIVDWSQQKKDFPHLRKVPFPKLPKLARISVLIGTDYNKLFKPVRVVDNPASDNDPWAVQTPLGWTCIGASAKKGSKSRKGESENMVVFQNVLFVRSQN